MKARLDANRAVPKQYVCPVCGYNMIGQCPEHCLKAISLKSRA